MTIPAHNSNQVDWLNGELLNSVVHSLVTDFNPRRIYLIGSGRADPDREEAAGAAQMAERIRGVVPARLPEEVRPQ